MPRALLAVVLLTLFACPTDPGGDDGGGGSDGGEDGGGVGPRWTLYGIAGPDPLQDLDMAVGPDGRVGIAYVATLGTDGGITDYELRYQEWNAGQISDPEPVRVVQRVNGVDVAFMPTGEPAMTFLGGDNVTPLGTSAFWLQSDAVVARRSGGTGGTWTEEVVTKNGDEAVSGDSTSDRGFVVGLNAALAFDGTTTWLAWRDGHDGQFPQQDWNGSDLEVASGSQGSWDRAVVLAGGMNKQAWGGHIQMVIAEGQPALASDQMFGEEKGGGQNLIFNRRNANGTWSAPIRPMDDLGNTMSGPSLDWDPVLGFAIAVVDKSVEALYFTRSVNDGVTWSEADPVYQSGSGGWWPSLSIHPGTHDPSIAFHVCSKTAGVAEGNCPEGDDALRVSERIGGIWREQEVDPAGGWHPKLGHLEDGRRVIVYRDPRSGAIKLAVENPGG